MRPVADPPRAHRAGERLGARDLRGDGVVEDAAADLQKHGFFGAPQVDGHTELPCKQDVAGGGAEREQGDRVAPVEKLAFLGDPGGIGAADAVGNAMEGRPGGALLVVVEDLDLRSGAVKGWCGRVRRIGTHV